jgi:hypothetical protein
MPEKFWMYDVTQLFSSLSLLPSQDDTLPAKLNAIMRLALIACIIIAFYKPVLAFSTLILVMVITMSAYSGAVADPTVEGFEDPTAGCGTNQQLFEFMKEFNSTRYPDLNKVGFPTTQKRFCNDEVPLQYNSNFVSANQELVGGPNPKTRIPPLVAAPSHDLDSWKNNDFVVYSQINRETNFDADRSGYNCGILPTKCSECMYIPCQCNNDNMPIKVNREKNVQDNVEIIEGFSPLPPGKSQNLERGNGIIERFGHVGIRNLSTTPTRRLIGRGFPNHRDLIRRFIQYYDGDISNRRSVRRYVKNVFLNRRLGNVNDFEIDQVIDELSNNQSQMQSQPEFQPHPEKPPQPQSPDISPCFESPKRDNLITQTLQPGVFQKSHIGEPIQSNIGISYTQEWGPTEVQETDDMIKYTMRDPSNVIITPTLKTETIGQSNANVYDPRFTGYSTSYRSYVDKLTGQPRFFYDDIDSITMPNYITRSKVDVFPWANTYGPDKIMDASDYSEHRQLANNAFTDSAITFRTELQERLMRKRNAELWQRRVAPISTMGRLGSSMKSCL